MPAANIIENHDTNPNCGRACGPPRRTLPSGDTARTTHSSTNRLPMIMMKLSKCCRMPPRNRAMAALNPAGSSSAAITASTINVTANGKTVRCTRRPMNSSPRSGVPMCWSRPRSYASRSISRSSSTT